MLKKGIVSFLIVFTLLTTFITIPNNTTKILADTIANTTSIDSLMALISNGKVGQNNYIVFDKTDWKVQYKPDLESTTDWKDAISTFRSIDGNESRFLLSQNGDSYLHFEKSIPTFHLSSNSKQMACLVYTVPQEGIYQIFGNPQFNTISLTTAAALSTKLKIEFWIEKNGEMLNETSVSLSKNNNCVKMPVCEIIATKNDEIRFVIQIEEGDICQEVSLSPMCALEAKSIEAANGDFAKYALFLKKNTELSPQTLGAWKVQYNKSPYAPEWNDFSVNNLGWGNSVSEYIGATAAGYRIDGIENYHYLIYGEGTPARPYGKFCISANSGDYEAGALTYTAEKDGKYTFCGNTMTPNIETLSSYTQNNSNSKYNLVFYVTVNDVEINGTRRTFGYNKIQSCEFPEAVVDLKKGDELRFVFEAAKGIGWQNELMFVPVVKEIVTLANSSSAKNSLINAINQFLDGEVSGTAISSFGENNMGITYGASDWSYRISYNGDGATWQNLKSSWLEAGYTSKGDILTGANSYIKRRNDLPVLNIKTCSLVSNAVIPQIYAGGSKTNCSSFTSALTYTAPVKSSYTFCGDEVFPYIALADSKQNAVIFQIKVNGEIKTEPITLDSQNPKIEMPTITLELNKGDKVDFCIIMAKEKDDNGVTLRSNVFLSPTVKRNFNPTLSLNHDTITTDIGSTLQIIAKSNNSNQIDVTQTVVFSSSNNSVATIEKGGLVTAKANGTATITATLTEYGMSAECNITVKNADISTVDVWYADNLTDVLYSSEKPNQFTHTVSMAKGESEGIQLAIRNNAFKTLENVTVSMTPFSEKNAPTISISTIEYLYTSKSSVGQTKEQYPAKFIREGENGYFPEYYLPDNTIHYIPKNVTRSFLLECTTGPETFSGTYKTTVTITTERGTLSLPLTIQVYNALLPTGKDSEIGYLNRAKTIGHGAALSGHDKYAVKVMYSKEYGITMFSNEHWTLLKNYASVMKKQRQNIIDIPIEALALDGLSISSDESYTMDWTNFDRFVETFLNYGSIKYIACTSIMDKDWSDTENKSQYSNTIRTISFYKNGKNVNSKWIDASSPEGIDFINKFFSLLYEHINQKGWSDIWIQQVLDEPFNVDQTITASKIYSQLKEIAKKVNPDWDLKTLDAANLGYYDSSTLSINAVQVDRYTQAKATFDSLANDGTELWAYTCVNPQGGNVQYPQAEWLTRIGDYPLISTRTIGWYMYDNNLSGYLHYAWNSWNTAVNYNYSSTAPQAFEDMYCTDAVSDAFIVYPDRENLSVYETMRSSAVRDGFEDNEIIRLSEKNNAEQTFSIIDNILLSIFGII